MSFECFRCGTQFPDRVFRTVCPCGQIIQNDNFRSFKLAALSELPPPRHRKTSG